jgi:hypothetical protein
VGRIERSYRVTLRDHVMSLQKNGTENDLD